MDTKGLLFLCVANSARSQMAEGIARTLAPVGIRIFSAGSEPAVVNPLAIEALAEIGIDISHHESKPISAVPADEIGTVVTLCDEESRLQVFRDVRDELRRRIPEFFK